jgi:lysophospholipase L1-like esterase
MPLRQRQQIILRGSLHMECQYQCVPDTPSSRVSDAKSTPFSSEKPTAISLYGDSITWLGLYQKVVRTALASGAGTKHLNITLINQGVNGGTVTDLVVGYSPWGHLDPHLPRTNITFAQTLLRDKPDVVAIEIGVNDVMQQPSRGENVSTYETVLREQVVKVAKATGARVYLST